MTEFFGFSDEPSLRKVKKATNFVLGMRSEYVPPRGPKSDSSGDGGRGTQRIHFTIDSYDSDTGVATCTVRFRPYGVSTVTGEVNGKVDVEDPAGCYFDEEEYDLVDRWGHADLMTEVGDTYGEGVWIVSGLCCPPA